VDANVGLRQHAYQTQFTVYCPVESFRVESVSYEANGGGNQISLVSIDPIHMGNKLLRAPLALPRHEVLVKENNRNFFLNRPQSIG
jgi:hypothetical protein